MTLPTQLDAKHRNLRHRLEKLTGDAFDREYMRDMVRDHEYDVQKFQSESKSGRPPEVKQWAEKTLPMLEAHLARAKEVAAKVGAAPADTGSH